MKRVGVILSGGASRRFGAPKAFAEFRGRPMYQTVRDQLSRVVDQILVVSHPELVSQFSKDTRIDITEDLAPFQGKGPLAGLFTAFKVSKADELLVFPCDAPLVQESYMDWLLEKSSELKEEDGGVPSFNGRLHPLMGFYRQGCLAVLETLLKTDQLRVRGLIDQANIPILHVPNRLTETPFYNVNTREDLDQLNANN